MRLVEADAIPAVSASVRPRGLAGLRAEPVLGGLVVILLAAAGLRLWGLGVKSLWFDESYSVFIAEQPLLEIPRLLRLYDTHPPLYYMLLNLWIGVFGKSEVALRLPSVLVSLGVVALTFVLGRRLAGDRVGLLAAVLIALSPFQVTASQEARMYPFLTLFGLGASYALWLAVEEGQRRHWIAYVLLMLAALYTHHFGVLLLLAHGAYVLAARRRPGAARAWIIAVAVVALGYLPLVPALRVQLVSARNWPEIRPPFTFRAVTDTLGMFGFGGGLFGMGTYFRRGPLPLEYRAAILLPFLLLVGFGAAGLGAWRKRWYLLTYWLVPVGAVALVSLVWNIYYERYFSFVLPPFAILTAGGVFCVADALRPPRGRVAVVSLLSLLAAFTIPALVDVYRQPTSYDWRGAAMRVTAAARPDDFVLFIPAFARIPFQYYFKGPQRRAALNPNVSPKNPDKIALVAADIKQMTDIARRHPRLWIVATIPIGYNTRKEIAKVLAPAFREVEGRQYGLVYVFLWESRLYGTAP